MPPPLQAADLIESISATLQFSASDRLKRTLRLGCTALGLAAALSMTTASWAQTLEAAQAHQHSFAEMISKFVLVPPGEPQSEVLAKVSVAMGFLKRMELPRASRAMNEALQLDARNSYLHFFNGFIYHLQARQGDSQKNELAIEGYVQALRIDPSNWIAREFLGLAQMDLKQYGQAKAQFSEVLLMVPESSVSTYGLMVAAYMTGEPDLACAMADAYQKHAQAPYSAFIASSVTVYASCGNFDKATRMRAELAKLERNAIDGARVDRRLAQWKAVYQARRLPGHGNPEAASGLARPPLGDDGTPQRLATAFKVTSPEGPSGSTSPTSPDAPPVARPAGPDRSAEDRPPPVADASGAYNPATPRMVLVDVVMVSTEEQITTAKGINLLSALTFQLGSSTSPAWSRNYGQNLSRDLETGTVLGNTATTAITRALTVPALSYSLNIANAGSGNSEVLARPTLAALEGLPSEFFSGTNLNAGVVSASVSGVTTVPVDKRFGVKLAVTPNFLPDGMVKLKVDAMRTFLTASTDSNGFAYRFDVSETSANANVVMKLGDTLVLSGLSEKETTQSRTGVPVLQDVPGVQYLFSQKRSLDFQRSVLILITPREPAYTSKAAPNLGTAADANMEALRGKLGFSEKTPSNIESIVNHLRTTPLYREFRQGDVSLERWDRMHSTGDRLRQAVEFLYY